MEYVRLTLLSEGREESRELESGTNLLKGMQGFKDFDFDAPCGGVGTCGKCKVLVDGIVSPPAEVELKQLSTLQLEQGIRLACLCRQEGDCRVTPLFSSSGARIVTHMLELRQEIDPPFRLEKLELVPPSLKDQRSDLERLLKALEDADISINTAGPDIELMQELPGRLRRDDFRLTISLIDREFLALADDADGSGCGIAVDIGTTTVVAYLIDLKDGKNLSVVSGLNLQKGWGGDVISRVQAAIDNGPELLARAIQGQLGRMVLRLMEEAEVSWSKLRGIAVAGNTVMMHLFAGVDPRNIAVSPFIPVFTASRLEQSDHLIPELPVNLPLILMPSISGFIGADITAGIIATGMHELEKPALLIDIGTNGEIVLGDKKRLLACSTAAGPAFEGATISCGVGGIPGAINSVACDGSDFKLTTIGDIQPIGICGSGIIDLVAILVAFGIVDEGGRLLPLEELPVGVPEVLRLRVAEEGFLAAHTSEGAPIIFTPRDVREVQLAKASVAAGIEVLLEAGGIGIEEVDRVFLAGGFGSYIDTAGAVGIGLLPLPLLDRITPAGNTAGAGAVRMLLSRDIYRTMNSLTSRVVYIELSANHRFQELYVEQMFFPVP